MGEYLKQILLANPSYIYHVSIWFQFLTQV